MLHEVAGCEGCPVYNGEWMACFHPAHQANSSTAPSVYNGTGGIDEQIEALHLHRQTGDHSLPEPLYPLWCPLLKSPLILRLKGKS